jgi:hypothetical protein
VVKRVSEKITKSYVHPPKPAQNSAHHGPARPGPARPTRARGASPRTRPQPGPGPGKRLPTWAKSSPRARPLSAAVGSNPTAVRPSRPDQNRRAAPLPSNPSSFLPPPSPAPPRPLPFPLPRDGDRGDGAAAGLLAGERARLCVSAPPSSGP